MSPYNIMFALLTFLGLVAVTPAFMYFVGLRASSMPDYTLVLVNLVLPAMTALYLTSWLQPRRS